MKAGSIKSVNVSRKFSENTTSVSVEIDAKFFCGCAAREVINIIVDNCYNLLTTFDKTNSLILH